MMDKGLALVELERLAERLGIEVRREPLPGRGGLCRIRGTRILFLASSLSVAEQVETMAEALSEVDLTQVYLRPALRQLLGGQDAEGPAEG